MLKKLRYEIGGLDETDTALLKALSIDARTSIVDLARNVGLSPPSVSERIRRLEETGTITGYSAVIDPQSLGLPISVWLRIRPVPGEMRRVAEILNDLPEVVECDRITGEDCFMAKAYLPSVADLEALIDEIVPYAMTNTSIIQSSPVPRRLPPIPKKQV